MMPRINTPSMKNVTFEMVKDYVDSLGGWDLDKDENFRK